MMHRELVLTFERDRWHARGAGIDVAHRELRGLEALIEAQLAGGASVVEVNLKFDPAGLPSWLRQYHGHYCNYTLYVPRRGVQS
jgi:hypothetical protein